MRPAYHQGDLVVYARLMPGGVDYGDAVILKDVFGKECIKRIVGLPGDQIVMDDTGRIYRNGALVPEGSYFYLGDNRPVSNDSRQMGCISKKQLCGKVFLTFRR